MRTSLLLSILLMIFVFTIPLAVIDAQQAPQRFGTQSVLMWDAVTADVEGNPEVVTSYDLAMWPATSALTNTPLRIATVPSTQVEAQIAAMLVGIPNRDEIKFAVRATDQAGNMSDWSDPLIGQVDNVPPRPPAKPGCRLLGK